MTTLQESEALEAIANVVNSHTDRLDSIDESLRGIGNVVNGHTDRLDSIDARLVLMEDDVGKILRILEQRP